jgi:L-seryl-tRNA(Ser) seleniumtransferase
MDVTEAQPPDGRQHDLRRALPSVGRLLETPEVGELLAQHARTEVVDALRTALADARATVGSEPGGSSQAEIVHQASLLLRASGEGSLRRVINATGVVLHTNLGRAPLSDATVRAMERVARGYSALEFDLAAGARGSRHEHVSDLLHRLTGAEAALVVNNNASAVLLALAALAVGREVIISRGQLVEIGGGFRIPDVLRQSGATLVEVGTTNRTYVEDFARAVTPDTSVLLRVHASNFRVVGFTQETTLLELAALAREQGLVVVDDLGSGSLLPSERYGLAHEPMAQESVREGADVVCFSGDKLLGGPQAGILIGKADVIGRLRRHPLTRAVRPDKATLAGLRATLMHYVRGEAEREVPVWRMIAATRANLTDRGHRIVQQSGSTVVRVVDAASAIGGGSLPGMTLPSAAIALRSPTRPPQELAAELRRWAVPIVGHIAHDEVLLDLRTVLDDEDDDMARALAALNQ